MIETVSRWNVKSINYIQNLPKCEHWAEEKEYNNRGENMIEIKVKSSRIKKNEIQMNDDW